MVRKRSEGKKKVIISVVLFVLFFALVFLGIQFFTKTGIFKIPGKIYYDESLNDDEITILSEIFNDEITLDKDVKISASEYDVLPELSDNSFLYEVYVPVTDFYDTRVDVSEFDKNEYTFIPFDELDNTKKLLSVNGKYFLNQFDNGARFRVINFDSEKYSDEIQPLVASKFTKVFPTNETVLSFAQTGVTALSRALNAKLQSVGSAEYFSEKISDYLSAFDLTHISNESSFTDYANGSNICSDPRFINTLISIGVDIVELTGNHNQDCGDVAASNTIDVYTQNNMRTVGGGKTADEAAKPLLINDKNSGITFLAYNLSTGGATYDNTPGANQYYEENAISEISSAKARGDTVIIDIQYYECSAYASTYEDPTCDYADSSAGDQVGFFRHLIDLGADVVVGTSAHQPQTFELYQDGAIYYGLGNLFFDQIWWPGTTRSLILEHYFYNNKLIQTRITPTIYDNNMQTRLLEPEASKAFIERLLSVRP